MRSEDAGTGRNGTHACVHDGHLLNARALLQLRQHRGVFSKWLLGKYTNQNCFCFLLFPICSVVWKKKRDILCFPLKEKTKEISLVYLVRTRYASSKNSILNQV